MLTIVRRSAPIFAVALCGACIEAPEAEETQEVPRCLEDGSGELVIGDATSEFTPLRGDREPQLHHGIQGGQHLVVSLRIRGFDLDPTGYSIEYVAEDACMHSDACPWEVIGRSTSEVTTSTEWMPGEVELPATVLVVLRWDPARQRRIRAVLTDVCGGARDIAVEFRGSL